MRRIVVTFGLIAGFIMSVLMLITASMAERIGFDKGVFVGYTMMVAGFLMVFFGVKSYRDNVAGGTIRFGQAFKVGLVITLIASVCYVASWEFIGMRMMPDFMDRYAAYVIEQERASGASESQVAAKQQEMNRLKEQYRNPAIRLAYTFLEPLPVGLLITLTSAGVLSRRKRTVTSASVTGPPATPSPSR